MTQIENLTILANWLKANMTAIKAQNAFDMSKYECGTCHCAAGWARHIPAFKQFSQIEDPVFPWDACDYTAFVKHTFDLTPSMPEFDFLFNAGWKYYDNSIEGAIARIRYLVDGNEVPKSKNFSNPEIYKAYLPE